MSIANHVFLYVSTGDNVLWGAMRYSMGLFRCSRDEKELEDACEVGRKTFKEIMRRHDLSHKKNQPENKQ